MTGNDRKIALICLTDLLTKKISLAISFNKYKLTPLAKEICFGVCRYYYALEKTALKFMKKKPKDTDVWLCIIIGLYQILFLSMPAYAIVKETVSLLDDPKKRWAKGFVNGVLRSMLKDKNLSSQKNSEDFKYAHPPWFIKKLQKAWKDNWEQILIHNNEHPPMSLRVNLQKTSRDEVLRLLNSKNISATPCKFTTTGLTIYPPQNVDSLPGFKEGLISVQDNAAQLTPSMLHLADKLRVLDACAAPGGKACHILETMSLNLDTLEIDERRVSKIKDNLQRLDLKAKVIKGDATKPDTWWDGQPYQRILIDAPCSATGVIRRNPDIKLLRTPEEIENIKKVQSNILDSLWPLLAKNGSLVYVTCSILPEENSEQIESFLKRHADASLKPGAYDWGVNTGFGWQILPSAANMDLFFYSVILKI